MGRKNKDNTTTFVSLMEQTDGHCESLASIRGFSDLLNFEECNFISNRPTEKTVKKGKKDKKGKKSVSRPLFLKNLIVDLVL